MRWECIRRGKSVASNNGSNSILQAIEKQGERFEHSLEKLTTHTVAMSQTIGELAQAIKFQSEHQHTHPPKSSNGNGNGTSTWTLLFGVGSLVFGLLAPLYFMLQAANDNIDHTRNLATGQVVSAEMRVVDKMRSTDSRISRNEDTLAALTSRSAQQLSMFKEMEAQMRGLCFKHSSRMAALEYKAELHVFTSAICATLVSPPPN